MGNWNVLVFLLCAKATALNLKITSNAVGLAPIVLDCSNTLMVTEDDAKSFYLQPSSDMIDVDHTEWFDNNSVRNKNVKKKKKELFTIETCNKAGKTTKASGSVSKRLLQQCTNTDIKGTPWHVLLYRADENMLFCQGVLIDKHWVLTVAHCLVEYDGTYLKPEHLRVQIKGSSKHIKAAKVIIHKDFRYSTFTHDIALLKIDPAKEQVTKPICLPDTIALNNQPLRSAWWEGDVYDDSLFGDFFEGKAKKISAAVCKGKTGLHQTTYSLDNSNICSGNPDYCDGDMWLRLTNGAPLFLKGDSRSVLVGLHSWETGTFSCESGSRTQIHVEISKYLKWIFNEIQK